MPPATSTDPDSGAVVLVEDDRDDDMNFDLCDDFMDDLEPLEIIDLDSDGELLPSMIRDEQFHNRHSHVHDNHVPSPLASDRIHSNQSAAVARRQCDFRPASSIMPTSRIVSKSNTDGDCINDSTWLDFDDSDVIVEPLLDCASVASLAASDVAMGTGNDSAQSENYHRGGCSTKAAATTHNAAEAASRDVAGDAAAADVTSECNDDELSQELERYESSSVQPPLKAAVTSLPYQSVRQQVSASTMSFFTAPAAQ